MISVSLSTGVYHSYATAMRVGHRHGSVMLSAGSKTIELSTPTAHKIGFALASKAGQAQKGEHVTLSINGEQVKLLPEHALNLGGAILRKTDDADDYQRAMRAKQ